mmetsp:Transcript_6859/g.20115  ORF Transcript_6859/g.20115 Transcript_6859/m.20115 type:complete len:80 (+) Transcript_6859:957-1196(+)
MGQELHIGIIAWAGRAVNKGHHNSVPHRSMLDSPPQQIDLTMIGECAKQGTDSTPRTFTFVPSIFLWEWRPHRPWPATK